MGAQTRHHAGAFHLHRLIKKENDCKRNTDRENQVSQPVARIEEVRVPFPASRRRRRISAWGWRMILPVRHHLIFYTTGGGFSFHWSVACFVGRA